MASALPLSQAAQSAVRGFIKHQANSKQHWLTLAILGLGMTYSVILTMPSLPLMLISMVFGWALILLAIIDLAIYRLPDVITLPLVALGLVNAWWLPSAHLADHIIGALAGYGVLAAIAYTYRRWRGHDGLGLGDAKLVAAAGAWLGWASLPSVVLIACVVAFAWIALRAVLAGRASVRDRIAFGAPLALAIWSVWLAGPLMPLK